MGGGHLMTHAEYDREELIDLLNGFPRPPSPPAAHP